MAALAPMPSASVMMTVAVRPLARRSERMPMRISRPSAVTASNQRVYPDAPHGFAHVRDVAELAQRGEARRLRIFAAVDPFLHAEREMAADFVVEIAIVGPHDATPCSPPDS